MRIKPFPESLGRELNELEKSLEKLLVGSENYTLINPKQEKYRVFHYFQFVSTPEGMFKTLIAYPGGKLKEAPRFPNCIKVDEADAPKCFEREMKEHIKNNFSYPERALKGGFQGKVFAMFSVSDSGEIINVHARGPHKVLEEEAIRIVKLLPRMQTGKINGVPSKTPFTIPINFRLK